MSVKNQMGKLHQESACIRLCTGLAEKPPECLECVVAHELVNLLEPALNKRFTTLMTHWKHFQKQPKVCLHAVATCFRKQYYGGISESAILLALARAPSSSLKLAIVVGSTWRWAEARVV